MFIVPQPPLQQCINLQQLAEAIRPAALVSVMAVNNEIGGWCADHTRIVLSGVVRSYTPVSVCGWHLRLGLHLMCTLASW
jgi:hypothetical protein